MSSYASPGSPVALASSRWRDFSTPPINNLGVIIRPAAGPGIRNVCDSLLVQIATSLVAPAAKDLTFTVYDDVNPIYTVRLAVPPAIGQLVTVSPSNLQIVGSANRQMIFQFSDIAGANAYEIIAIAGYLA